MSNQGDKAREPTIHVCGDNREMLLVRIAELKVENARLREINLRYEKELLITQLFRGRGVGGNMVTGYTCLRCNQECASATTSTPIFCPDCTKEARRQALTKSPRTSGVDHRNVWGE